MFNLTSHTVSTSFQYPEITLRRLVKPTYQRLSNLWQSHGHMNIQIIRCHFLHLRHMALSHLYHTTPTSARTSLAHICDKHYSQASIIYSVSSTQDTVTSIKSGSSIIWVQPNSTILYHDITWHLLWIPTTRVDPYC